MKQKFLPAIYLTLVTVTCLSLFACNQRPADPAAQSVTGPTGASIDPVSGTPKLPADGTTSADQTVSVAQPAIISDKPLSEADKKFFMAAAQSGYAEVVASQMAKERSTSSLIKDFADMMVIEHSGADKDLRALAKTKSLQLPENDAGKYQAALDALGKLDGIAFDRAYVERIGVVAHRETVSLFDATMASTSNPDVKAFAGNFLPSLKRHLEMAQNLPKL